jgi:hypothetical protein
MQDVPLVSFFSKQTLKQRVERVILSRKEGCENTVVGVQNDAVEPKVPHTVNSGADETLYSQRAPDTVSRDEPYNGSSSETNAHSLSDPPDGYYKISNLSPESYKKLHPEWRAGKSIFFRSFKDKSIKDTKDKSRKIISKEAASKRKALCRYCQHIFDVTDYSILTEHVNQCSSIPVDIKELYHTELVSFISNSDSFDALAF